MKIKIYSIEPVLQVNNMKESLEYYQKIGFHVDWTWPDENNFKTADHASVSIGDGHEGEEHDGGHVHIQLSQADKVPVTPSGWLYLRVDMNIDELYMYFKGNGAEVVGELDSFPWGMREFTIKDINGHLFRFAIPLE